jgi:flagellar hook-associated protein 2
MAAQVGQLDSTFTNLITNMMTIERQPLTRLTTQQTSLTTKKSIYNDFKTKLDTLLASIRSLKSSDPFFSFSPGRKVSTTTNTSGVTMVSAAASTTAVTGSYTISDVTLAKSHTVRSDRQTYTDQGLGYSGAILVGGASDRSIGTTTSSATVDAFSTSSTIYTGQQELGTSTYYVETRLSGTTQQFRLVDSDGNAVSIRNGSSSSFTSTWQNLTTTGEYDTGRGLKLNFTGSFDAKMKDTGAASVAYQAKGVSLDIAASDSLIEIASKINNANYAAGNELQAGIVDNQLFLSTKSTGASKQIIASGSVLDNLGITGSGSFTHVVSTGRDASFKVNDMTITRSQNTNLTNVISGVTLNLSSDAEGTGKTATITITGDTASQKTQINDFIKNVNSTLAYIKDKTAVTKNADGTYTRAALAGDSMVLNLRNDISRIFEATYTNSGTLNKLRDIGLSVDENNQVTISDSTKLENALSTNYGSVKSLLDAAMTDMYNRINRYTGTTGYVSTAITAATREGDALKDQITTLNSRLAKREQQLYDQFAQAQATLESLSSQQSTLIAGFNALSKYSSS